MAGNALESFFVSIAYQVDERSRQRFVAGLEIAAKQVAAFAAAFTGVATAVVAGTAKMAQSVESAYFSAARSGTAIESLKAFSFAASQLGVSAGQAQSSVEGLASFLRGNPGGEGFLNRLGVGTRDANGQLRDTTALLGDLGKQFASMPFFAAKSYANVLGIDEHTLLAMRDGTFGKAQADYAAMVRRSGVDMEGAGRDAHAFMSDLRSLGAAFDILQVKVMATLSRTIGPGVHTLREVLLTNIGRIADGIAKAGAVLIEFAEGIVRLALRAGQGVRSLWEWFGSLDERGKAIIETIGGLTAAWIAFNRGFLATPTGRIVALASSLLLLYDDYRVWKEGGQSLIDWAKWEPQIQAALAGIGDLGRAFDGLLRDLRDLWTAAGPILTSMFGEKGGLFSGNLTGYIQKSIREARTLIETLSGIARLVAAISRGDWGEAAREAVKLGASLDSPEAAEQRRRNMMPHHERGLSPAEVEELRGNAPLRRAWDGVRGLLPRWMGGRRVTETADKTLPAEARGLLDTIAGTESPGYDVIYGGRRVGDLSRHPNIAVPIESGPNAGKTSSAAGRYQFIKGTWDDAQRALNLPDFSPESQDKAAWWLAQKEYRDRTRRDLLQDLRSGDPTLRASIGTMLRKQWTSLPGGIEAGTTGGRFASELGANIARNMPPVPEQPPPQVLRDLEQALRLRGNVAFDGTFRPAPLLPGGASPAAAGTMGNTATTNSSVLNQNTTVNVQGGTPDTARQVADMQARINQDAIRNLAGAVR